MSEELKPCPFCDGHGVIPQYIEEAEAWAIFCEHCGSSTGYNNTEKQATEAWNKRAE